MRPDAPWNWEPLDGQYALKGRMVFYWLIVKNIRF